MLFDQVYTISLLLLMLTWTPFYIGHVVLVLSSTNYFTILLSPLIISAATLYAPLSAVLHGYRNTKIRRELCQMFSVTISEDVATPLPTRKIFRSMSVREASRLRGQSRPVRHSFTHDINSNRPSKPCIESQTLLLTLTPSSSESSARSSFSSGPNHPRYVTILARQRQEATC